MKARLISTSDLAPEVRHFEFELPQHAHFQFIPGQFVSIKEDVDGKAITRAYSIASPPSGNRFSLCLNRVSDGLVSPRLFGMQPGDEIEVEEPLGYFTLRHPGKPAVFVATGTGIAPVRSILAGALPNISAPVALVFGARHGHNLLYDSEWRDMEKQHPHFRFLPTVTRAGSDWTGRVGRVQAHLDEALAHTGPSPDVYICGLKDMVDDVRMLLKNKGFDRRQLIYEKYD